MVALDFHHLRNPRVIKAGVLTLAAVGISVGVGVTVANHRRNGKGADAAGGIGGDFTNEYEVVQPDHLGAQPDHLDAIEESSDAKHNPAETPDGSPLTEDAAAKLRYYEAEGGGYSDYPVDDYNGDPVDGKEDDDWGGGWNDDWNDDGRVNWEKCWYPLPSFPNDDYVPPHWNGGSGKSGKTKGGKTKGGYYNDYWGKGGKTKGGFYSGSSKGGKTKG